MQSGHSIPQWKTMKPQNIYFIPFEDCRRWICPASKLRFQPRENNFVKMEFIRSICAQTTDEHTDLEVFFVWLEIMNKPVSTVS